MTQQSNAVEQSSATQFYQSMTATLHRVVASQRHEIAAAGAVIADAVLAGGLIHAFGSGHSEAMAMEVAARAGGLIPTNRIAFRDLVIYGGADPSVVMDDKIERDPGTAAALFRIADPRSGDAFVIGSSSGINGVVVELASLIKQAGHPLIAITSREHSDASQSRHPSGRKLADIADLVLDNGAPYGDAVVTVDGVGSICGVSSITAATLVQMVVAEAVDHIHSSGTLPPVYLSANIANGDQHNDALESRYSPRLRRSA